MNKLKKIDIQNTIISITSIHEEDYICLTDIAKAKQGTNRTADIIKNWIRARTTIEFLDVSIPSFGGNLEQKFS